MKAAREEAVQHISAARATAVKIRREYERELEAAVARRDSINAQLSNVRQMLATFDNTSSSLSDRLAELKRGEDEVVAEAEVVQEAEEVAEDVVDEVESEQAEGEDQGQNASTESDLELTEVIEVKNSRRRVSSRGQQ